MLTSNGPTRRRAGPTRRRAGVLAGVTAVAALLLMVSALASPGARAQAGLRAAAPPAVTGNDCPTMVYTPKADFYPVQPSFHAGDDNIWQWYTNPRTGTSTTKWGYVLSAQFPYSQWMAWNTYNTEGIPQLTVNRTAIKPDPGSVNPFETGRARPGTVVLLPPGAPDDPDSTPGTVLESMRARYGEANVVVRAWHR